MATHVIGLFDDINQAHAAMRDLSDKLGIPYADMSLVANDAAGEYGKVVTRKDFKKDATGGGAATGASIGAVLGGIGGLLVGLGALVIPGIGPVIAAGPLAAGLATLVGAGAGAVAGGVAGGLLGALVDLGIPEEEARYYTEGVRRGGVLVTVKTEERLADRVRSLLTTDGALNIRDRVSAWQQQGWKGYDPKAKPYTAEEIAAERNRYRVQPPMSR